MKDSLKALCESFIVSRDTVKSAYKMESSCIYPLCANIFVSRDRTADENALLSCKRLIKDQTGVFSNFRGSVQAPLACFLSLTDRPEEKLSLALDFYDLLKQSFWASEYLSLAAVLLTEMTDRPTAEEKIVRGRTLYQRMKKEHPFLTSSEDSVFAVLLAFSEKDDDALIEDMEACYRLLKEQFSDSNCVQTVSHVLALAEGTPQEKTDRMLRLFDGIRAAGGKYGRHYELAPLAALALLPLEMEGTIQDILSVDEFLSRQKGYGFWGLDRRIRMMHAVMVVSDACMPNGQMEAAAMTSTLSLIAAQQMATCAVICSSSAAATSAHA